MAKSYRPVDRNQVFLLPPDMSEWLPPNHLVWFIIDSIEQMNTTAFHRAAKLGGVGRQGYDPDMLITLFVYAMANGVSSSRKIEKLCQTDIAFRIICAQDTPDHTTLARFRQTHEKALTDMLGQSLELAANLEMLKFGVVALDGTKIQGNASISANKRKETLDKLAQKYVTEGIEADKTEDAQHDKDENSNPPDFPVDRSNRRRRIQEALKVVEERQQKRDANPERLAKLKADADRASTRYEETHARHLRLYEQSLQAQNAGERAPGRRRKHPDITARIERLRVVRDNTEKRYRDATDPQPEPEASSMGSRHRSARKKQPTANLTDPESRIMKIRNGWVQGFNCQTAASENGFILVARATNDPTDVGQFTSTMDELTELAATLNNRSTPRKPLEINTLLADAGYDNFENFNAPGPERLIAARDGTNVHRHCTEQIGECECPDNAVTRERTREYLATTEGKALYNKRAHTIEAPHAWLKDGRGLRRFARRGLNAAQAELSLASATTNLLTIFRRKTHAPAL